MAHFCEKCGGTMSVVKEDKEEELRCDVCGHTQPLPEDSEEGGMGSDVAEEEAKRVRKGSEIIYEGEQERSITQIECPECGHVGAHERKITTTFAKAESKIMYTCEECGYSWEG